MSHAAMPNRTVLQKLFERPFHSRHGARDQNSGVRKFCFFGRPS